jgi:hypothetical protein
MTKEERHSCEALALAIVSAHGLSEVGPGGETPPLHGRQDARRYTANDAYGHVLRVRDKSGVELIS